MNRLLQHFVADQDGAAGGGSDWVSQRAQEETSNSPFTAPAPTPPPFEDVPLSSSTTGAKYDTVDLFDDGPSKSSQAFPAAPAASESPRDAPVHDFFGSSQPAHDPFGSVAQQPQHDPFASAPAHQHSPFGAAPEQQHSPFGAASEQQHSPFGAASEQQHSPFGAASEHQQSPFAASPQEQHDPFSSSTSQQQDPFSSSTSQEHDPFSSTARQQSTSDSAPEHHADPFSSATQHDHSPFGSATGQHQSPFASAPADQAHDPFAASPEQYPTTHEQQYPAAHEQQYYQGHDQYAQHQYDSNGYDYYAQHDQASYYDQYQQQQYGGDQGYTGEYQYSAEEYQYYQSHNGGENAEAAASVFGQHEYHQEGYGNGEMVTQEETAPVVQGEPVPAADAFFQNAELPPVSSGSPFGEPANPFAQPPANGADPFHQHTQDSSFSKESVVPLANGNQDGSGVDAPVHDFFTSNNNGHADASSLFSSSTTTDEVHRESLFGSSHSPVQSASAPSPVSHQVQTPPPAPIAVPTASPVRVEDKTSQLQGAFSSFNISGMESENPADDSDQCSKPTAEPKGRTTSSTLDDTMRLAEMYKQMAERLQTEKNDLLKVLADQTDQFYHMQDYIRSLEREVEEYRSKDMST